MTHPPPRLAWTVWGLGALLYLVVTSDTVESALSGIFERALNTQ